MTPWPGVPVVHLTHPGATGQGVETAQQQLSMVVVLIHVPKLMMMIMTVVLLCLMLLTYLPMMGSLH